MKKILVVSLLLFCSLRGSESVKQICALIDEWIKTAESTQCVVPKELLADLTVQDKHAVYQHLHDRVVAYKNVSDYYHDQGLMTDQAIEEDNKKIEKFEQAIHDQMK